MAFARQLLRGDPKEKAMLRKAPNEQIFGFQIATKQIDEGVAAAKMAAEAGATFIDLNCGCPIYEATRRGLGSSLLKKPRKLARLVNGIAAQSPIPVTVKVRVGVNSSSINIEEVTELLRQAGAAVVSIHGRTAEARYKKPASWELIQKVAESKVEVGGGGGGGEYHHHQVPIIGNGDVLTHYEATRRLADHGCHAVMVGRGALTKPWIFGEVRDGKEYELTSQERVGIYRQLTTYMKEHFGDDDKGKRKAFYFLPWHFDFFTRWRPLPEGVYGELSKQQPLISTRWDSIAGTAMGQRVEDMTLLDRLLSCDNREGAHPAMANALWEAGSDQDAVVKFEKLAEEHLVEWEEQSRSGGDDGRDREKIEAQG
jgi:tRNA-dihydrouridine synthase 3